MVQRRIRAVRVAPAARAYPEGAAGTAVLIARARVGLEQGAVGGATPDQGRARCPYGALVPNGAFSPTRRALLIARVSKASISQHLTTCRSIAQVFHNRLISQHFHNTSTTLCMRSFPKHPGTLDTSK